MSTPGRLAGGATGRREADATLARRVLAGAVALTLLLHLLPLDGLVGYPLLLFSTLVHELGHGLTALATGGQFGDLRVFGDGSGVARTASGSTLDGALVAAGGLIGPAVGAALGLVLARRAVLARGALVALGLFFGVCALLWVRGLVGLGVTLVATALCLLVATRTKAAWAPQLWLVFLSVQLGLSVFSRGDYLFASVARTGRGTFDSDTARIADALLGGPLFWGLVCGAVSVAALVAGGVVFLRGLSPHPPAQPT